MPQHTLNVPNGTGAAVRGGFNDALVALGSLMRGPSAPPSPVAGMLWVDDNEPSTTVWTLKIYDGSDWIGFALIDTSNNRVVALGPFSGGSAGVPGIAFAGDADTGIGSVAANVLDLLTGGAVRIKIGSTGNVVIGGPLSSTSRLAVYGAGTGSLSFTLYCANFAGSELFIVRDDGLLVAPRMFGVHTTAAAANLFIGSSGEILQSTSSELFKHGIEDLDLDLAERVEEAIRPVWYRSTSEHDPAGWSWYGLIAERVAELDPRLVCWREAEDELPPGTPCIKVARAGGVVTMRPVSVAYDRVLLLCAAAHRRRLARLNERVAALEASLAARDPAKPHLGGLTDVSLDPSPRAREG